MGRRGPAGPQVNLLRVVELLQTHITPALCHAVFGRVRRTERQRVWTLDALVRFWTAVILRAPTALSQALADARDAREPLFPRIEGTPEAFFQRCRDLRPAFFAEVFRRFTARLVGAVPPRYAAEVAPICEGRPRSQDRWSALTKAGSSRHPWSSASIIATRVRRRKIRPACGGYRPRGSRRSAGQRGSPRSSSAWRLKLHTE
jgi:hypothetical protein